MATLITFLISAFGHELVMGCITKKLRGYGFLAQMMQLPIVALQRTKFVKGRTLFNNVCFWISMILGLSMVSSFSSQMIEKVQADFFRFTDVRALCPRLSILPLSISFLNNPPHKRIPLNIQTNHSNQPTTQNPYDKTKKNKNQSTVKTSQEIYFRQPNVFI